MLCTDALLDTYDAMLGVTCLTQMDRVILLLLHQLNMYVGIGM